MKDQIGIPLPHLSCRKTESFKIIGATATSVEYFLTFKVTANLQPEMEEENIQTENRSVNNCTFVRIRGFPR